MAQLSYEEFMKFNQKSNRNNDGNVKPRTFVKYFGLGDDGDTAIVRFNVKDINDLKMTSRHRCTTNAGKIRNVACLRQDPTEPLDNCPLCAAGIPLDFRLYVPLISYEQDDSGETVAAPCLWERSVKFRDTLQTFITDYGDLRDYVFKIVRHGKHGDKGTTYSIVPANPNIYKEDQFKKDFSGFDSLDFNRFVTAKTADEMNIFLDEGDFPNPFVKTNSVNEQSAVTSNQITTEPVTEPNTEETPFVPKQNPLRTSGPLRGTYTTTQKQQDSAEQKTPGPRRYSY